MGPARCYVVDVTDSELIERYRRGRVEAMEELVERHRRRLFGMIVGMTGPGVNAEEVFQETWFRAISKVSSFKKGNFFGWLARIAHNIVIDRARAGKRELSLDGSEDEGPAPGDSIPGGGFCAAEDVADAELGTRIAGAVAELPVSQREVFAMRMYADMPFKEIARVQGVSINTALARMQYALAKLREALKQDYQVVAQGRREVV